MAITFPTSLDALTNPTSTDPQNSPSHSGQHADINDAVEALEAKVGIDGSAVTTSIDYKLAQFHHEANVIYVGVDGDYATIAAAITYLDTLSTTDGYLIKLEPGTHEVPDTITIELTMSVYFLGSGSDVTYISAATGLVNKDMFVLRSDVYFSKITFDGTLTGWKAGTTATFLKYDTAGVYSEITDFWMDTAGIGIEITKAAEVFAFNYEIAGCVIGVDVTSDGAAAIDCEIGNFSDCDTAVNLAAGVLCDIYLVTLRFLNTAGQTAIAYNGTNLTYTTFTMQNCEWNQIGTFSTGFDFTLARDANIEILNCVGTEDNKPHAKISLDGGTTVTAVDANTWTKAVFTNTSSYACKWTIANNRMTYQSDHPRDIMMILDGAIYQASSTQIIEYAIVKNGNAATTVYGKSKITIDAANRNFTIGTNVYLSAVAKNDYFEVWFRNITDGDDVYMAELNWFTHSL